MWFHQTFEQTHEFLKMEATRFSRIASWFCVLTEDRDEGDESLLQRMYEVLANVSERLVEQAQELVRICIEGAAVQQQEYLVPYPTS